MCKGSHKTDLQSQKNLFISFASVYVIFVLLLISSTYSPFHEGFAASPAFDQLLILDEHRSNQKNDWVQTYGNGSANLRSEHADILR